jgi:hypothetical protein
LGGKSLFAVSGDTLSSFRYSIEGGVFLDTTKRDSLVVQWGMQEGLYRIGMQEIAFGGCEGNWVYMNVKLSGMPFRFENAQRTLCPGDTLHLPRIDPNLYKKIRWSDSKAVERGIVQPGNYQLWVEDLYGCKYTDTLKVTICDLPSLIKSACPPNKEPSQSSKK